MKTKLKFLIAVLALALVGTLPAQAQVALKSTTLSAAVNGSLGTGGAGGARSQYIQVATSTNMVAYQTYLYVDMELMQVLGVPSTGTLLVQRGVEGTRATSHNSGATVYYSTGVTGALIPTNASNNAGGSFIAYDPYGSCKPTNSQVLPQINIQDGLRWNCINTQWMVDNGEFVVPPTDCTAYASANGTTPSGYGVVGASNTFVVQQAVTGTGTNTITYTCQVTMPQGVVSPGRSAAVTDVTFLYGVQSNALGTQAATLASGTFNGTTLYTTIVMPTPAASETASTVTPARADSGTITITPVAASFNTAVTTAGAFYSAKFQPGPNTYATGSTIVTGLPINTDLSTFQFSVTLQCAATTATQTNSPGLIVHYAYIPDQGQTQAH